MARSVKPEKILESLKKLYEKRTALDRQILETEKSFIAATSAPTGKTATGNKSTPSPRKRTTTKRPPVKK
jgi:hypothetical protein